MENGASSYHRFLQGDNSALEELVTRYSDAVVRYAYCFVHSAAVAEDIAEDAFAALIVKRKKLQSDSDFAAYLFRTARNKCIDHLRKHDGRTVPLCDAENVLTCESAEYDAFKSARDRKIYAALQILPEQYRETLYLTYYAGFSADELCEATHNGKKRVYNLLARAKAALKEILIKEGIDNEDI